MFICPFCNCAVPNVEAAIDNDWIPDWWQVDPRTGTETWRSDPVCDQCAETYLQPMNGEYINRPGIAVPKPY